MDIIDGLIKDLYSQKFYNGTMINPTRFFILNSLFGNGTLVSRYEICDINYMVYCLYIDNPSIAERHPNIQIRNLYKYGIDPIKDEVFQALKNWIDDSKSNFISFDNSHIYLKECNNISIDDIEYLITVVEEYFKKIFNIPMPKIEEIVGADNDLIAFGKGAFFKHELADMQYCVCCDEYKTENLVAVHILQDCESDDISHSRKSKNNGLIMCNVHAQEYLHHRFYFDKDGHAINKSSSFISKTTRISSQLLNKERRIYLGKKQKIEEQRN